MLKKLGGALGDVCPLRFALLTVRPRLSVSPHHSVVALVVLSRRLPCKCRGDDEM